MSGRLDPPADPRQLLQDRTPQEPLGTIDPLELTGPSGINDATATVDVAADHPQGTRLASGARPRPWPADECHEPPDDALPGPQPPVAVPAAVITSTIETLNLLDEFLRLRASSITRAELRAFAASKGWHPTQGAEVLIESIGLDALSLTQALDAIVTDWH